MEIIGGIAIILIWIFAGTILNFLGMATKSVFKTATGKGSFSENLDLEMNGMGPFQVRFNDIPFGDGSGAILVKEIQVKGQLPFNISTNLGFVTSVLDNTSGEYEEVLSADTDFQESKTYAYQHKIEVGIVKANVGFTSWVRAGIIIPSIINTPYGGKRSLVACLRLVDLDEPIEINSGFGDPKKPPLHISLLEFDQDIVGVGYVEAKELKAEANELSLKIGIYLAMSDGTLSDEEGESLKDWIKTILETSGNIDNEEEKNRLNQVLRDTYQVALSGDLILSPLIDRLALIADISDKYKMIEKCYDVAMKSGGGNMKIVENIANVLGLNLNEIEKIRDQKLVAYDPMEQPINIEELLGIDASWDKDKTKRHLRSEFVKWNNRITALPEGSEREMAQTMLDAIAEERKKYD
jgi:hypothetical protein